MGAGEEAKASTVDFRPEPAAEYQAPAATRLVWLRREVIRRDSVFRRTLGLADMTSIMVALR